MTPKFLEAFDRLDVALVRAGFPATSPWWREQIERFATSGRRRWTIRAGRRAGKSSTLSRLAVAWALFGTWSVPPGDVGVIPFVSISREEAAARLRTIAEILRALGVEFEERGDAIELITKRAMFRVTTCSTTGVVGFISIAVFGDEVARWESRDLAANPAREVVASLSPTLATQPTGFLVLSSSPWSEDDFHAESFDRGDSDQQLVSFAPTWIANPTISEADTLALEPDPRAWSREYAAEPGHTISDALDRLQVLAAFGRVPVGKETGAFVAIDPSSLRGDAFGWIAGVRTDKGETIVREAGEFDLKTLAEIDMGTIVDQIAAFAGRYGVRTVFSDQREEAALGALFRQRGIELKSFAWTEPSKDAAMQAMRRVLNEGKLCLTEHVGLRKELLGMRCRLAPSGRFSYPTSGLDFASCLVTLFHAEGDVAHDEAIREHWRNVVKTAQDPGSSWNRYFNSRGNYFLHNGRWLQKQFVGGGGGGIRRMTRRWSLLVSL